MVFQDQGSGGSFRVIINLFHRFTGSPCGGVISDAVGILTFNTTDGAWRYGPFLENHFSIDCLWTLIAPQDMLIEVDISQLYHDKHAKSLDYTCTDGFLEVTSNKYLTEHFMFIF